VIRIKNGTFPESRTKTLPEIFLSSTGAPLACLPPRYSIQSRDNPVWDYYYVTLHMTKSMQGHASSACMPMQVDSLLFSSHDHHMAPNPKAPSGKAYY